MHNGHNAQNPKRSARSSPKARLAWLAGRLGEIAPGSAHQSTSSKVSHTSALHNLHHCCFSFDTLDAVSPSRCENRTSALHNMHNIHISPTHPGCAIHCHARSHDKQPNNAPSRANEHCATQIPNPSNRTDQFLLVEISFQNIIWEARGGGVATV